MIIVIAPWLVAVAGLVGYVLTANEKKARLWFAVFCIGLWYAMGALPVVLK